MVTSGELVQAVFRNSKSISFEPIANAGSGRVFAIPKDTMDVLTHQTSDSKDSIMSKTTRGMHTSMLPGSALLQMNSRALTAFAVFLKDIGTNEQPINLHRWVRDCFTLSSAEAFYGAENPIAEDKSLIQSLEYALPPFLLTLIRKQLTKHHRDFGASIGPLFLNIYPSLTAPKGHRARLAYAKAFLAFYERGLVKNASGIVQGRYANLTAGGMTHADLGSFEIGVVVAATMNSVEGMFWMLCYLFADRELLEEVRVEIDGIAKRNKEEICLDVSQLQKDCPLLVSVWQETLRMANVAVSSRVVVEDVVLNDTYFLKKGSVVQIPARVMHNSSAVWGSDAHIFNGKRFLKSNVNNLTREEKKLQKQGFTPFGGGVVLCPGRHFATTEILGVAATIAMGFEMRMVDGGGVLKVPRARKQGMSVAVKQPESEVEVSMRRRTGFEGVTWTYDVRGEVDAGDMVF